jgi:trk system potassium uptake protein TrkH
MPFKFPAAARLKDIPCSPGSTVGGVKTSTFTLLLLVMYSILKGKRDVEVFQKRIDSQDDSF